MKKQEFQDLLVRLNACVSARKWVTMQPGETAREILRKCERGDWLLWLAERCEVDRRQLVFAAAQCARLALPYSTDARVEACIIACEQWSRGEISSKTLEQAQSAAAASAASAYADAARTQTLRQCVDIVRANISWPIMRDALLAMVRKTAV